MNLSKLNQTGSFFTLFQELSIAFGNDKLI